MGLLQYALAAVVTLFAIVYGTVIFFSHQPRLPIDSELEYITNDGLEKRHKLPPTLTSTSERPVSELEKTTELSVIIPCYNETQRLGKMMYECVDVLRKYYKKDNLFEIMIVDDGSSDGTGKYALQLADELKLAPHTMKVVTLAKNRGKGGGVTHGLLHCSGKLGLFADADGATSFSDVTKLIDYFKTKDGEIDTVHPKIAVGSRSHMVNTDAVVKRSFIRNFLMYGLHTLVFIFGIRDVKDTQCGFKMFNVESIKRIFPHMHTERWIFDVEVLLLGELQDIPVKEIAVNWQEIDGSKVDLARDSIEMAIDLVVTRLAYLLGVYKLDECGRK